MNIPTPTLPYPLPYPLRYRCAYDARLTSGVLRAFLRALFAELRRRARQQASVPRGQCGAVTFIQRFGSALNVNLHFHTLVLDGVYANAEGRLTHFFALPPPSCDDVARAPASGGGGSAIAPGRKTPTPIPKRPTACPSTAA